VNEGALLARAAEVAPRFDIEGTIRDVTAHRGGHINDSFVVATTARRYLLQRLNPRVFLHPEQVMENITNVTGHIARALAAVGTKDAERRVLTVIPARGGGGLVRDDAGDSWRMYRYIEGAVSRETARDAADAQAAARAFGLFQHQLADYHGPALHATIPNFHATHKRVAALERACSGAPADRLRNAAAEIALVKENSVLALLFDVARNRYEAIERIAHHDAKIANLLFDETSGEALCVVDLDTVMPGLSLFDFADLVRSMVSPAAEDETDAARVTAEPARFAAIVRGYLGGVGDLLRSDERGLLERAAEAMIFEQGVRFLTDYLEGDTYYKTSRPAQNLDRCRTQFALLRSLWRQQAEFTRLARLE
jgi:Ser/Thr protein kinase RdoA (MazF antagonist)